MVDASVPVDASRDACADDPCGANSICTETADDPRGYTCICNAGYVESGNACRLPRTCRELLTSQPGSVDGLYVLDPDLDAPGQPFETFCDMSMDGGGWTLVQRTVWDFAETRLLHTDYATFQGVLLGSPASGEAFRVPAARWPALQETREHLMRKVPRRTSDGGDCGTLYYKATHGVWTVPTEGNATLAGVNDPILLFNTVSAVSTADDGPSRACVNGNLAVPWPYRLAATPALPTRVVTGTTVPIPCHVGWTSRTCRGRPCSPDAHPSSRAGATATAATTV